MYWGIDHARMDGGLERRFIPDGVGVLAGLAVEEAQFLDGLGKGVFRGHVCGGRLLSMTVYRGRGGVD